MSDPASLILNVGVRGLSMTEAVVVLGAAPAGATLTVDISQPAIGGMRYSIASENLSAAGAQTLVGALMAHLERVAKGDPPLPVLRCGQRSVHAPHVVDHGPDQPRNCPGVTP